MTFVSYAQNFEDVVLWRALNDVEHGRYLDVGAQDPVIDSVSLAFYKAGWRGMHVEATPAYAARLRDARPDETVIEAAVTDAVGPIDFYEIAETGLSTGRPEVAKRQAKAGYPGRKIMVPCVRLDKLLEKAGDVHWLKIDVEGMEPDVLRSWGKSKRRPWVLVIESTFPSTQELTEQLWIDEVLGRGYQHAFFDGLSRYFVHETQSDRAQRMLAPANVFDEFTVTERHFAARDVAGSFWVDLEAERANAALISTGLRAEIDQLQTTAAIAIDEGLSLRTDVQQARLTRDAAIAERDSASEREKAALSQSAILHKEHFAALESLWRERRSADEELRRERQSTEEILRRERRESEDALRHARQVAEEELRHERRVAEEEIRRTSSELERRLRDEVLQAQSTANEQRTERARLEERSAQLQELLRRSDESVRQAHEKLERLQSVIANASGLIEGVLRQRPRNWERLGLALGFTKPSSAVQALTNWNGPGRHAAPTLQKMNSVWIADTGTPMMTLSTIEQRNPYLRADSLPELLSWHDIDFVRCAYVTIVGRQPDPEGEAYYAERIRRGHSKLEVIFQLRRSPEGSAHDPGIAGLDRVLKRARLERHSIIGWMVRGFTGGEGNSSGWKRHRVLLGRLALIQNEQIRQTSWIGNIDAKLSNLREIAVAPAAVAPVAVAPATSAHDQPTVAAVTSNELDPELDSRSRYALQLLQIEAKAF